MIGNQCGCALLYQGKRVTKLRVLGSPNLGKTSSPAFLFINNHLFSFFPAFFFSFSFQIYTIRIYTRFCVFEIPFIVLASLLYNLPTMFKSTLAIFALVAYSIAAPAPEYVEERHIVEVYKRQADISQLLQLASLAGVTALPTDPAVLLQLGPLANSLASALPTSSVLGVLLTAAPSGFVSSIVNDPSYASSFESAFSAGNSPAWFNSLPTNVRSYLHTYSGLGGLAGAGAAIKSVTADAGNDTAAATGSGMSGSSLTSSSGSPTTQNAAQSAASVSSASAAYVAAAEATSSSSKGGAARPTGAVAAGLAGMVGVLGVAAAAAL